MQYSFKAPVFQVNSEKQNNLSFSIAPQQVQEMPLLGAEIGPDPRNATCTIRLGERPAFCENGFYYDFTFGYRLLCPPQGNYHVIISDLDGGGVFFDAVVRGGAFLVGERKYFIRYHIRAYDNDSGKLCFEHRFDCRGKKVYIMVPDGGLGENFAWMPYAEEFRRFHKADVSCVIGEWFIRLFKDRYPKLKFLPVLERPSVGDGYACYFCSAFPKERSSWRPVAHQHYGMQKSIAQAFGLPLEYLKVRVKLDAPRPFPEPFVCISSMATNPSKYWNHPEGWSKLIAFLKSIGYRVLDIDRDPVLYFAGKKYTFPPEAEDFTGAKPIAERIDLLQHADFFVGLPSGLSWVAWNCNIPVVMLTGFSMDGAEFPTPYRITNYNYCHGCWSDTGEFFDTKAPVWCPRHGGTEREIECTKVISPEMVIETVKKIPCVQKRMAEAGMN